MTAPILGQIWGSDWRFNFRKQVEAAYKTRNVNDKSYSTMVEVWLSLQYSNTVTSTINTVQ